ncbi:MAG TPA: SDR family oxidoreductase [Myxococcota bacterium]|nr:SDR family oxidoreductase [Myxococcota bacterium]HQK52115.1 SDR family oxidoreductase [Myxococcota bacterium]
MTRRNTTDVRPGARVLITGAGGGIGRCLAREFARARCVLFLTDRDAEGLDRTAEEVRALGAEVFVRAVDVTDREAVAACLPWVENQGGPLDVLINNAGVGHSGPLTTTSFEVWRRLVEVNLFGAIHHVETFLPGMLQRSRGTVVNVSSGQAFFRLPGWGAYAAVKAALGIWSEMLAFEVAPRGVRIVTAYPFLVRTGFYRDVDPGRTAWSRWSMRLLPLCSVSPESAARRIFLAARNGTRVEWMHPLNQVGFYQHLLPPVANLSTAMLTRLLVGHPEVPSATPGGAP